jgi:hypothetical protein
MIGFNPCKWITEMVILRLVWENRGILERNKDWLMMGSDCRVLEVPHDGIYQCSG